MTLFQFFLVAFGISIPAVALLVAGRHSVVAYRAARRNRHGVAFFAMLSIVCLIAMVVAVAIVWFGYGVAHKQKTTWDDLWVVLYTGLPFYLMSFFFWRFAGYLGNLARTPSSESDDDTERLVR